MSNAVRRSGRQRKANPKYKDDLQDKAVREIFNDLSGSDFGSKSHETSVLEEAEEAWSSDQEYDEERGIQQDSDLASSNGDKSSLAFRESAASSEIHTPDDSGNDGLGQTNNNTTFPRKGKSQTNAVRGTFPHSRGIKQVSRKASKTTVYSQFFGPTAEDLAPILIARDTWLKARDTIFPSRRTLGEEIGKERIEEAFSSSKNLPLNDSNSDLVDSPLAISRSRQGLEDIDDAELRSKYLVDSKVHHSVVLGPWICQKYYNLKYLASLDFGRAWSKVISDATITTQSHLAGTSKPSTSANLEVANNSSTHSNPATPSHDTEQMMERYREGWLLNVGQKPQCLAWANSRDPIQYLAMSCRTSAVQRSYVPEENRHISPAFRLSSGHPSSIQIWAFETRPIQNGALRTLTMTCSPRLGLVLATEIGNIRQLQWAPGWGGNQKNNFSQSSGKCKVGWLAAISSDGAARLFNVDISIHQHAKSLKGQKVIDPALKILPRLNDTIFTTMAFASSTVIILAESDGSISLYDLTNAAETDQQLKPFMTCQLHNTYIMSLCTTQSASIPTYLASTSASGDLRLTDLRNPDQDCMNVHRARLPTKNLIYSPFTRSFITTVDHSGQSDPKAPSQTLIACHNLRHFYTGIQIAKLPPLSGSATALAGSRDHPCILVGNARGTVFATNFLRRVIPTGGRTKKTNNSGWLQKLCEYDWRGSLEVTNVVEKSDGSVNNIGTTVPPYLENDQLFHGRDVQAGTSIFQEGFKPQEIGLGTSGPMKRNSQKKSVSKSKSKFTSNREAGSEQKPPVQPDTSPASSSNNPIEPAASTAAEVIFEEEQAVTAIEWNPNAPTSGIVAIAWGSGIVRVQDLSHDYV